MKRGPFSGSKESPSDEDKPHSKSSHRRMPALQYAYKLLGYRGRSEKELCERLRMKGYEERAIDRVIANLKSNGLIDDRKLASSLARYADETKRLSINGAKRFLLERGVPSNMIDEAVRVIDEDANAAKLVDKRLRALSKYDNIDAPARRTDGRWVGSGASRRLYGMLYRKGFGPGAIRRALEQLKDMEDSI